MASKYVLGGYFGNPNGNDASAEADFEQRFNSFVSTMGGAKPVAMNAFVDFSHDPSSWAADASWTAWSWTQAPVVQTSITPVIGVPMSDNSHWAGNAAGSTNDDFFKGIINGSYDGDYKGVVDSWVKAGFQTIDLRLGYEMDGGFMPWYMGDDPGTQSDWVKAFQHLSTLMHGEATALGATAKIVWNPTDINWTNQSVQNSYPGDAYVDVVSVDAYSPLYPLDLYDWAKNDGTVDATIQQWAAAPINREHFWSYPNASQWNPTGTPGSGFGIEDAIALAKAHGKALAISESGAGGDGQTTGPVDDPDFPKWLASELAKAQSQGVPIAYVNIWDVQLSDGNWNFSPGSGKPQEAVAWGQYFGNGSGNSSSSGAPPLPVGTGSDTLVLNLSEDAYQGDAQFTVSVDGAQLGAAQSITTLHGQGTPEAFTFKGSFGPGPHTVGVTFLNDSYDGPGLDRNLFLDSATFNAAQVEGAAPLYSAGTVSFAVTGAAAPPPPVVVPPVVVPGAPPAAPATDTLQLSLSEDAWQGDAQAFVTVDGKQVGGMLTVTAAHAQGKAQTISLTGSWGPGAHDVGVQFVNDAYGGTATTDRNLYVNKLTLDGQASAAPPATLYSNGTAHLATAASPLVLQLSEDAWQGDAQFTVAVDGKTLGAAQAVTALHAKGAVQDFAFGTAMAAGTHDVAVSFLNDAYGGTAATDRNLYVSAVDANGKAMAGTTATLLSTATQHFAVVVAAHL